MSDGGFRPHWALRGGHRMTIAAHLRRRRFRTAAGDAEERRVFAVAPGCAVLARCHWQPDRRRAPTVVLVHGFSGCAGSGYMIGTADKAWAQGCNVVRMNLRSCGGTEDLSATLYHAGLHEDLASVVRELVVEDGLAPVHVIGFSLGGNIALRFAARSVAGIGDQVGRVAVVSPALDLAAGVGRIDSGGIHRIYHRGFMQHLRAVYRRQAVLRPESFDLADLRGVRTVYDFDDAITAPRFGFADAADYYRRASALDTVAEIRVPTLVLQAEDDPMVAPAQLEHPGWRGQRFVTIERTRRGGHCAFVTDRPGPGDLDRYWGEARAVRFVLTGT